MNSNLQITYEISEQDFLDAQKLAIRNHPKRSTRLTFRLLPYWGLLLAGAIAWAIFQPDFEWRASSLLPLVFVIPALFSPLLNQRSRKAAYRRNTSLHGARSVVVNEQGLSFKGPGFSSQVNWPIFVRFAEDDKVFVLFQSSHVFHIIPKRQLSPQQIADLREAFTRHIATRNKPD